jgi:hypothetical protein
MGVRANSPFNCYVGLACNKGLQSLASFMAMAMRVACTSASERRIWITNSVLVLAAMLSALRLGTRGKRMEGNTQLRAYRSARLLMTYCAPPSTGAVYPHVYMNIPCTTAVLWCC